MAGRISHDPEERDTDWSAREIARRNRDSVGKPLNPVMKAAATACELAHGAAAQAGRQESDSRSGKASAWPLSQ